MSPKTDRSRAVPTLSRLVLALAATALLACGGGDGAAATTAPVSPVPPPPTRPLAMIGSDLSALPALEGLGATYTDSLGRRDAVRILRDAGHATVRLRLFVDPTGDDVVVNDLPYTLALAARARAAGASVLLDFHYSDTWADPGRQTVPAAWRTLPLEALEAEVERYTADVMAQFRARGLLPRWVQLGNEIDGGLLWPHGRLGDGSATPRAGFGRLLRAAVRGVRQVVASPDTTAVLLHWSQGGDVAGARWFVAQLDAERVAFDGLALSYYPWWHGSLASLRTTIDAIGEERGVDVFVVETAYPWRPDWVAPAGATGPLAFERSPAGQQAFARALMATVAATRRGAGVLWWYPEAVPVPGRTVWAGGALALFDASGRLLPAAGAFR